MSDSTPMVMMMMMGMAGSACLSIVGGLAVWYVKDNTLGGLLPGDETDPPSGTPASDAEESKGIPLDTKVYIHGILEKCDGEHSYTLLYVRDKTDVDTACTRDSSNKNRYLWTISKQKSGKWTYYTIKNAEDNKYLKADGDVLTLSDDTFLWRIKSQKNDSASFSISSKDTNRMLNFWNETCQEKNGRRIHTYAGSSYDDVKDNSKFRFRKASAGWGGGVKNPC
jgi:hypothetical protein